MKYLSTRNNKLNKSFNDILFEGLSKDGGLYLPHQWPKIDINKLFDKSYPEVAAKIIHKFVEENISEDELLNISEKTYQNFNNDKIAPINQLEKNKYLLELFYGPTYAFKDYALQFLGNLFSSILKKSPRKLTVLGATSGDTGSAAIHAFKSKKDINVFILHPHNKVSLLQQKQMTTVESKNIFNIAINGNFDDCQKIVKQLFIDSEIQNKTSLTAINSINWARIMSQVVYYFWAHILINKKNINFIVPSGNFGNIFSANVAKKMGLPIGRLHISTNKNDILKSIIENGKMKKNIVNQTISPSMDIQVSSNFERQIFESVGRESKKVNEIFSLFKTNNEYTFEKEVINSFKKIYDASSCNDEETIETIKNVYQKYNYIADPHTATGLKALLDKNDNETWVSLACAHPSKFSESVNKAINTKVNIPNDLLKLFDKKEKMTILPNNADEVKNYIIKNI